MLIKSCSLQRRLEGVEGAERGSGVMDGWRESQRDRWSELGGISMLSCILHLSGAPRGLLMPLSAMQY